MRTVIQALASAVDARRNCKASGNEWISRHEDTIDDIIRNCIPHGSGIDGTNTIDLDKSTREKIILGIEYHHMNENGYYDGWTSHNITITPAFDGIHLSISGRDRNDVKDYLYQIFDYALTREAPARFQWARDIITPAFGADVAALVNAGA